MWGWSSWSSNINLDLCFASLTQLLHLDLSGWGRSLRERAESLLSVCYLLVSFRLYDTSWRYLRCGPNRVFEDFVLTLVTLPDTTTKWMARRADLLDLKIISRSLPVFWGVSRDVSAQVEVASRRKQATEMQRCIPGKPTLPVLINYWLISISLKVVGGKRFKINSERKQGPVFWWSKICIFWTFSLSEAQF